MQVYSFVYIAGRATLARILGKLEPPDARQRDAADRQPHRLPVTGAGTDETCTALDAALGGLEIRASFEAGEQDLAQLLVAATQAAGSWE